MAVPAIVPRLARNTQNIQLSYELPHRINCARKYPVTSANGSSIILYAHDHGIRILWRGGKNFKSSSALNSEAQKASNGADNDTVMIIDSDSENPEVPGHLVDGNTEFEDDLDEYDQERSYPPIIQDVDLNFGLPALHLEVPPSSTMAPESGPAFLKDTLVLVATFADHLVRVITLPLSPPSPSSKARTSQTKHHHTLHAGKGNWGETVTELAGFSTIPDGVSMTFVPVQFRDSGRQKSSKTTESPWRMLVASYSREVTGLLLIHRLPVAESSKGSNATRLISNEHSAPSQIQYLSSPPTGLIFNPSILQGSQILLTDRAGVCRIYDSVPEVEPTDPNELGQGLWLLTLYPGFQTNKTDNLSASATTAQRNYGRKAIVDARWAMGGKSVVVLLSDGEWGLWDIEGNGPIAQRSFLDRKTVKGGATTTFSTSGWVDGPPVKSSSRSIPAPSSNSKFAPMTPGARKTAETSLFAGKGGHDFPRGRISISRLPARSSTDPVEECIVFWLEDSYSVITNLRSYWEAEVRRMSGGGGNIFGNGPRSHTIRLENIDLGGERCTDIIQYVEGGQSQKGALPADVLIVCEHRFIIVSGAAIQSRPRRQQALVIGQKQVGPETKPELDVAGIEQAINEMGGGLNQSRPLVSFK